MIPFALLEEVSYNFISDSYTPKKYIWFPGFCLIKQSRRIFKTLKLNYDKKGITSDSYLLRKLNMTNLPYLELYLHTFQFESDQMQQNVSVENETDLNALEWLVRDHYEK